MNKAFVALLFLAVMVGSIAAQQENSSVSFKSRVLSNTEQKVGVYANPPVSNIVAVQSAIWVTVGLVVVLFFTLRAMLSMDDNKEQDTILYAKFLANVN